MIASGAEGGKGTWGVVVPSRRAPATGSLGRAYRMLNRRPQAATPAEHIERYSIPEPNSGCFLWLGWVARKGHGLTTWKKKTMHAHRLAWIGRHGPIPDGLLVCHRCDVPSCVNPDHLFLGTHQDNMDDMVRKGRAAHNRNYTSGNRIPRKLTAEIVIAVRASEESTKGVARRLGVAPVTIRRIRQRKIWRHI